MLWAIIHHSALQRSGIACTHLPACSEERKGMHVPLPSLYTFSGRVKLRRQTALLAHASHNVPQGSQITLRSAMQWGIYYRIRADTTVGADESTEGRGLCLCLRSGWVSKVSSWDRYTGREGMRGCTGSWGKKLELADQWQQAQAGEAPGIPHQPSEHHDHHHFTSILQMLYKFLLSPSRIWYHTGQEILGKIVAISLKWQATKPPQEGGICLLSKVIQQR